MAGEEGEDDDARVEQIVRVERLARRRAADQVGGVLDVYAGRGQRRQVERAESVEAFRVYLGRAVAAHQAVFKEDADFRDHGPPFFVVVGGYFDTGQQILLAVRPQLAYGQLRAGYDDGLAQVFQHEAERGRGVGHRVRAVQHDESAVLPVVLVDDACYLDPILRLHVARVDRRVERDGVYLERETLELRDKVTELFHIKVLEGTGFRVFNHSDSPSGVNDKDGRL